MTATRRPDLCRSDRGATATEYALLLSMVALAIIVGLTLFGGNLNDLFTRLANGIANL